MELIYSPEAWMALVSLTLLEIVLGVDNIIFIAILAGRLPPHQQAKGRTIGLVMAMLLPEVTSDLSEADCFLFSKAPLKLMPAWRGRKNI